ncbi:MAG: polysaccharide biosynthesis/export family protein [Bacteroidales bacterium]
MNKCNRFYYLQLLLFSATLIILNSCVTQKQVKYLQRKQQNDTTLSYKNQRTSDYKIQPHDNLYIRIFNLDEKSYLFFNRQTTITNNIASEYTDQALYLDSYVVNDSGYIDFPLIGKIFMKDLTVDQSKNMIQSLINEYLKDVTVTVKLVSFNITILGEVRLPGTRKVYQDKVNIFEAISLAGDLSEYANRHKVALIRQTKTGSHVVYLDLNSIDILSSPYYYLEPNDILYIAPLGIKRWGAETFPWALVFSAISTTVLLIYYFK